MTCAIGVDPGKKAPFHVWRDSAGVLLASGTEAFATAPRICPVYVEGQFARPRSTRRSLMSLSWAAGACVGFYLALGHTVYVLEPSTWRPVIIKGTGTVPKSVFQNKCRRAGLVPDEIWVLGEDATDAYLILCAGDSLRKKGRLPKPATLRSYK